jgi:hypothetical protein
LRLLIKVIRVSYRNTREMIMASLKDVKPKTIREISKDTGLSRSQIGHSLMLAWRRGLILRTAKPVYEVERVNKGRGGVSHHVRPYHLYLRKGHTQGNVEMDGLRFVPFSEEYLDPRGGGAISKASRVLGFLRDNPGEAFYSKEVAKRLVDESVHIRDVMANVRRFEAQGLVYVRGYKTEDRETPFREGYLLTWLDPSKARETAIAEAVTRTEGKLDGVSAGSPLMERVMRVRDVVVEHSRLRRLVGFTYIHEKLSCTPDQAERAVRRAMELYPSLRDVKLFDAYRYYYHESLGGEELDAAVEMKRNYLRLAKGRANRIGHNWEAVAEWFIDRFTSGARFWTQNHREGGMDQRRINVHLLRGVGGRRNAAELDRVWEVTPGVFAPPVTYVLSCKWGIVSKKHVDDFLEVLRWSKDFGVDTPDGREMKQGIVGVFAAGAFDPRDHVEVKSEWISLPQYAARRNLQIVTASDFNGKLRERGCLKVVTVQKVCRTAKHEGEVREALDQIWKNPADGERALAELSNRNVELYSFEKMLAGSDKGERSEPIQTDEEYDEEQSPEA